MNFELLCKLGLHAKELAKKVGHYCAAQWLKAKGVSIRDALAIFGMRYCAIQLVWA